ncbi:hypothetical protein V8E54_012268 [Elaphomyces granulatus]
MSSESIHHCSFSAIVEFSDSPRVLHGSIIIIPATFWGPLWTTVPDLRSIGDIPLEIVFHNESDHVLTKGSFAVCFGCLCFRDRTPAIPTLAVNASRLNPCPGNPLPDSYVDAVPTMMNAFLDFVGVVDGLLQTKSDHRFVSVSVTVYAGIAAGPMSHETFDVCCVLLPQERWKKMDPRPGRTVQVQGDLIGFYLVKGRVSPCLLTQTLSYVDESATDP